MAVDIAVQFDQASYSADLVFNGRDFALDATPMSATLISLGTDQRAGPDDVLPDAYSATNPAQPASFLSRRGYPGDALDMLGRLMGGKLWLWQRSKSTEQTRKGVQGAVADCVTWLNTQRGLAVQIAVRWIGSNGQSQTAPTQILGYRVRVGATLVSLNLPQS